MGILVGTLSLIKLQAAHPNSEFLNQLLFTQPNSYILGRRDGRYVFPTLRLKVTSKKQMHLLHYLKKQSKAYRDRCRPACCNKCFCYKADRVLIHRSLLLTPAAKITPVRIKKSTYSKLREPEQG
jgi:hypothetical protein